MAYKDMREWIDKLDEEGELKRIKVEVNWDREIGAIVIKALERQGPALLFENIKDYKNTPCTKLFTNSMGSRFRSALALGLPNSRQATDRDIVYTFRDRFKKPVKPVIVKDGPVKEVIRKGNDIDLFQFPVPKWHHLDGGRYINTSCAVVTADPGTGRMNLGTYRGMITAKDRIGVLLATTQHWGHHFAKYRDKGEAMPVAVVIGWDPSLFIVAGTPVIHDEYDMIGALRQEPVELIKCETSDLMAPAWAELVIEGRISPDPKDFDMEGPFGEYTGYYGGMRSPKPTIQVECITHRREPIFRGTQPASTPGILAEGPFVYSFSAVAWDILESVGVPGVLDVWAHPVTASTNLRVRIKKIYRGHAKQVANALWGSGIANYSAKYLIVVDEDIDIFDDQAVEWALAYRVNAAMDDIVIFPGTFGSMLDPSVPLPQRDVIKYGQGKWARVLIDATINWELEMQEQYGGERYPPVATALDPEDKALVERRWAEYGLP